jgi:hypothetical protein
MLKLWENPLSSIEDRLEIAIREIARLTKENKLLEGEGWRTIETAPRDGSRFLAVYDKAPDGLWPVNVVWFDIYERLFAEARFIFESDDMITHWMPLPKPPEKKESSHD